MNSEADALIEGFFESVRQDEAAKERLALALKQRNESALAGIVESIAALIWGAAKTFATQLARAIVSQIASSW